MTNQKFKANSYRVGSRHCSDTVSIEADIKKADIKEWYKITVINAIKKNQWILLMIP